VAAATGRAGARRSAKRRAILQGAQRVMLDEGYASVTFDRVASATGVARGLVYYYFSTLDELFIAVLHDSTDRLVARLGAATTAGAPLRAAWDYAGDQTGTALVVEYLALANHRSAVRTAIGECGDRVRRSLAQAAAAHWPDGGRVRRGTGVGDGVHVELPPAPYRYGGVAGHRNRSRRRAGRG
jgi:AcrR family transcriptional regulator